MADLFIITKLKNLAKQDLKNLEGDIKGIGESADVAGAKSATFGDRVKSLSSTVTSTMAGLTAAAVVFKKAFDLGEEGQQIRQTEDRFNALNESIGALADNTLARLQDATDGAVSKFKLMEGSNLLMATRVAKTDDELVKLIENVIKLKKPTESAEQAVENFSLMMANQSIPRLDSFGISGAAARERILELTAGVNGLSREAAFNQAVLEQMEVTLGRVGQSAEFTADGFTQMRALTADLTDGFKKWLADGLNPVLKGLIDVRNELNETNDGGRTGFQKWLIVSNELTKSFNIFSGPTLDRWVQGVGNADEKIKILRDAIELTNEELEAMQPLLAEAAGADQVLAKYAQDAAIAIDEEALAVMRAGDAHSDFVISALKTADTEAAAAAETARLTAEQEANAEAAAAQAAATEALNLETGKYFNALLGMSEPLQISTAQLFEQAKGADLSAEQMGLLGVATGQLTEAQAQQMIQTALLQVEIDNLIAAYKAGTITADEATAATLRLANGESETAAKAISAVEQINAFGGAVATTGQQVDVYTSKLLGIPANVSTKASVDTSEAESKINRLKSMLGSLGQARALADEVDLGAASGADFIVPPGFSNDSFKLGVSSGERVIVQTPSQQIFNQYNTINSGAGAGQLMGDLQLFSVVNGR